MPSQVLLSILSLGASALTLVGLVLVVVALSGTRVGIDIRCRRCRHEFPRGGTIPPTCSDCGADLKPEHALVLGRYRPRVRMLAIGATLVVLLPVCILVLTGLMRSGAIATANAATPDALIDAAMADDVAAKSELSKRLRGYAGADYLGAWKVATERFTNDAMARATIIEAVCDAKMWTDSFPGSQGVAIDDITLRAFGDALARALEADASVAEVIPANVMDTRFASAMADPVLASPKAVRAFLRGPKLALRRLERPMPAQGGPARVIEPKLVVGGFTNFGRTLAFGQVSTSYVRKDGSTVDIALPPASQMPVLEPDWGTRIAIGPAIDDPEWSGEIRVKATVGTIASMNVARAATGAFPLVVDPFEYEWSIQVERVTPEEIRATAVCEPIVTGSITQSLRGASLQVHGGADGQTAVIELEHAVKINGVFARLEIEVVQDGRSWKEPRPPTQLHGQRPAFPVVGLDPLAPFQLIARGIRPAISEGVIADHAYAAGTWTVTFDRAARPPSSVQFTPLDGAPTTAPAEATSDGRDMGRVIRD